jgi:hypothetical protein
MFCPSKILRNSKVGKTNCYLTENYQPSFYKFLFNLNNKPTFVFDLHNFDKKLYNKNFEHYAGIYGWVNKTNNRIYIGRALSLKVRPFQHKMNSTRTNKYLYNDIQKCGLENFVLIIFVTFDKRLYKCKLNLIDKLISKEQYYLHIIKNKVKKTKEHDHSYS